MEFSGLQVCHAKADIFTMSMMAELLVGKRIEAVLCDSEVTYLMLDDGTQMTIRGFVAVEPGRPVNDCRAGVGADKECSDLDRRPI